MKKIFLLGSLALGGILSFAYAEEPSVAGTSEQSDLRAMAADPAAAERGFTGSWGRRGAAVDTGVPANTVLPGPRRGGPGGPVRVSLKRAQGSNGSGDTSSAGAVAGAALTGVVIGGLIGAVVGGLAGGPLLGMAIGAVAGALVFAGLFLLARAVFGQVIGGIIGH